MDVTRGDVAVTVPITYGTADGRVQSHTVPADLDVFSGQTNLNTSEDFACGTMPTIPYTPADCGALSYIVIQLRVANSGSAGAGEGGDLTVYEYAKNPNPTGAADATQKLKLSAP